MVSLLTTTHYPINILNYNTDESTCKIKRGTGYPVPRRFSAPRPIYLTVIAVFGVGIFVGSFPYTCAACTTRVTVPR